MAVSSERNQTELLAEVRSKAELFINSHPVEQQNTSFDDFERLLQELESHQIDFAMQSQELRHAQTEIEELRQRYLDLYDFAPVGYVTLNEKMLISELNQTASMLLGIENEFIINCSFTQFVCPNEIDHFYLQSRQAIETGYKQTTEQRLKKIDNSEFHALVNMFCTKYADAKRCDLIISFSNINALKQAEDEKIIAEYRLRLSQKMGTVSTLPAGVAHEFNNILSGITGYTEVAIDETPEGSPVRESLTEILKLINRARDVVKQTQRDGAIPTGTEHILAVDDEEHMTILMKKILERLGYRVTALNSSLEALALFKKDPQRYDLILTDLTMPHLTGDRLAAEVITIRPDMPVIIVTGYSYSVDSEKMKQSGIKALIPKPCQKDELANTVRLILDENQG